MNIGVISVRYARALLISSIDAGLEVKVYKEMQALADSYLSVPELRFTIDNPMLSSEKKKQLLIIAAGDDICQLTENFINLVVKEGREKMMQFIANSYITLYRKKKNIVSSKLIVASAISSDIEKKLRQIVECKTNGTVEFEKMTDSDLVGGFILEYDTYRMDASVKTKLQSILTQLSK